MNNKFDKYTETLERYRMISWLIGFILRISKFLSQLDHTSF